MTIEEFQNVELRVAKVLEAERVPESEKLIKLKVTLGDDERQIIAGIGKVYEPETLIGKEIVIVANLDTRMMLGLESQGMLLAASDEDGSPVLIMPDKEIAPGARIK